MAVDALDPTWINGVLMDGEELRRVQGFTLTPGATPGSTRTGVLNPRDLALTISGNNVLAGPGGCAIGTVKGAYITGLGAAATIGAMTAADLTNPRRDRVVLEILDPDNGGGAGRKGQLRIIDGVPNASAASGGGFPAAPTSPFIDLGFVDMPRSGAGAPVITARPPITATAGSPIPVRDLTERDALPVWAGLQVLRLDQSGAPTETHDGTAWGGTATPWTDVTLTDNFTHYVITGTWKGLRYQVSQNTVTINGAVRRSTAWAAGQRIGIMPAGLRPDGQFKGTNVHVDQDGTIRIQEGKPAGEAASLSISYPRA